MSTLKVNSIDTESGTTITVTSGKTITGTASQYQMTDVEQGDVLYGSTADTLSRLGAGSSGYFLKTLGAGQNPAWAEVVTDTSGAWTSGTATTGKTLVMGF